MDPITAFLNLIDKIIPDPKQAADIKLKTIELQQNGELEQIKESVTTIDAEAKGESWLQRNWRPVTMMSFTIIIINNYLLYPYLSLFWHAAPMLAIPPDMWSLLKIGLGGYVVGRSGEKIMQHWMSK